MSANAVTANIPADQLITAEEIAKRIRVTPTSVYRYAKQGLIPSYKIGGRVLFSEEGYAALLEKTRRG